MSRNKGLLCCRDVLIYWKSLIIIFAPLVFLPLLIVIGSTEAKCAYVVAVMALYWMAEVVPLAVTAFLPLFLFPLLGILDAAQTSANYLKDTNFLFFGGLMVALAVEQSNLHRRLALRVLLFVGSKPRWLMLGFMSVTAFLSMWISNTATTAMMVPIAIAVLEELVAPITSVILAAKPPAANVEMVDIETAAATKTDGDGITDINLNRLTNAYDNKAMVTTEGANSLDSAVVHLPPSEVPFQGEEMEEELVDGGHRLNTKKLSKANVKMCKGILLSICYSANIGGTGTLTGTGPNLVLRGQLATLYTNKDTGITFASWMLFAIPPLIVYMLTAWVLLQVCYLGISDVRNLCKRSGNEEARQHEKTVNALLRQKYTGMGRISFAEISVLVWFLLLVALWIFRDPKFMPGWSDFFLTGYVSDGSIAMMIGCVMFAWPNKLPDFICWRTNMEAKPKRREGLVTWPAMQKKFAWSVIMLLGGGFALADGVKQSGLSQWVGCAVQSAMANVDELWVMATFATLITFLTEISSNTATASVFIPIVISIAEHMNVHPLYYALPATICPSFAFMLPVATPPNAIVYDSKIVSIADMMWVGFIMNCLAIIITLINVNTYAMWIFNLNEYPSWAGVANGTTCA